VKPFDLAEEEIDSAGVDELRNAYRELLAEARMLRFKIGERTCIAVDDLRERGLKFNGNLPYGLEADDETKKLRASRYETRLIAEIKKLHARDLSLRAIARTLAERHFVNRDGKALDAKQVARILDAAGVERKRRSTMTTAATE
jgi:hypothetical protein